MHRPATRTALRIAGFYALSFAAASLLLGAVTWGFASRTLRRALDDRLQSELATLMLAEAREGRAALVADIVARDAVPGDGGYLLAARDGARVAGRVATAVPRPGFSDVQLHAAHRHIVPGRAIAVRLSDGALLAVVAEAASLESIERTLLMISGGGFGLMVAIGVIGGLLIGHAINRRLRAVDATARAIIEGDLSRRMPLRDSHDEFDRLAATLNRMLDHIAELMESLRHMSDDIAHDLRTPLARLRATLESASETADEPSRIAALDRSLVQLDEVMRLFATIQRISEVESGGVRALFDTVPLDLLVEDLVESYQPVAIDSGRTLRMEVSAPAVVQGEKGLLGQVIANLIENALKHTPVGTSICVSIEQTADCVVLTVADDGPGIPPAEYMIALRRFGRSEASRSTPGSGLGLALVAAIAAVHRAELSLEDGAPGLRVRLLFRGQV